MKMRFKRFLSGFMAVATLASVIVQPVTVSASELEPEPTSFEQQYPELQDVQDTLDKDEIVEAMYQFLREQSPKNANIKPVDFSQLFQGKTAYIL